MSNETMHSEPKPTPADGRFEETTMLTFDDGEDPESDLVLTIVEHVASLTERDVTELPPLYDSINPSALADIICQSSAGDSPVEVSFRYQDCLITVSSDGTIHVREL